MSFYSLKCSDYESIRIEFLIFHCTEKDAKMLLFPLYVTYLTIRELKNKTHCYHFCWPEDKIKHINRFAWARGFWWIKQHFRRLKYLEVMVLSLCCGVIFRIFNWNKQNLRGIWKTLKCSWYTTQSINRYLFPLLTLTVVHTYWR